MTLHDALNASLYAALIIIIFKVLVIMFKSGHDMFYVPPEAVPFEDDEDEEEFDTLQVSEGKMLCPVCKVTVIQVPAVGEQAICGGCKQRAIEEFTEKENNS